MNLESISSENLSKEVAYLLGVYLTDGYICSQGKFSVQVIDREFAELVLSSIKKLIPTCEANVYMRQNHTRWNKSPQFCVNAGFSSFKEFFQKQTNSKHHIPYLIWDAPLIIKKWFIAGVMDGDGFVSSHTRPNGTKQMTIGIGKVEDGWIIEFKEFLEKNGVRVNKPYRSLTKNGVPFVGFNIKICDFLEKGLFFTIKRKQARIELLRNVQRLNAAGPVTMGQDKVHGL